MKLTYSQNRMKRGRDMAIFRFFKMAAATILDFFEISNFLKSERSIRSRVVQTASSCQILLKSLLPRPRYVSINIIRVWLEMPYIHAPFWWVLGASDALMQELPCMSFMLLLLAYYCIHYAISARRYLESLG